LSAIPHEKSAFVNALLALQSFLMCESLKLLGIGSKKIDHSRLVANPTILFAFLFLAPLQDSESRKIFTGP
jgi:hypothetical protein